MILATRTMSGPLECLVKEQGLVCEKLDSMQPGFSIL
jgi:hypothetical protein